MFNKKIPSFFQATLNICKTLHSTGYISATFFWQLHRNKTKHNAKNRHFNSYFVIEIVCTVRLIIVRVPCTWKLFFSKVRDVLLIRLQVMVITFISICLGYELTLKHL